MLFFGLLLFIFLVTIRPQDFISGLMGARIVLYLMAVLLIGWLLSPVPKKMFRTSGDKFIGLFFLSMVISTLSVKWITYSVNTAIDTLKLALIYFFIVTIIENEQRFKIVTWTLVILMSVVGGISVLQYHGYDITGEGMIWSDDKQAWQIRGIGIFDNPNDIAYSVVLVVPFALGLIVQSRTFISYVGATILLGISSYAILITRSRGGYLATMVCLITWLNLRISGKTLKRVMILLGLIGIIGVFSIQTGGYREDSSAMGRVEAWVAGMSMLQSHPVIGVGKGQFREYHKRDSHNSYVRAGAELGLVGLYAFLGIIYAAFTFLLAKDVQIATVNWKLYNISYISYLSSFAVASLFSTRTYDMIFLVVIALVAVFKRLSMDKLENDENMAVIKEESVLNKYVFALTILCVIIWKLFLVQTW
jgi:O-antigen ligase